MERRCLYCYQPLKEDETDFHARCSRKIFGTSVAPILPYTRGHIGELAREVIRSQTTLTGVQPKLSLDLQKTKEARGSLTIVGALGGRYILKPQTDQFPHFLTAMTDSGLQPKVIDSIFAKYDKTLPKIRQLITDSFLPAEMQSRFIEIIETNLNVLKTTAR